MEANSRGHGSHARGDGCLGKTQFIDGDELEDGPLCLGQSLHCVVEVTLLAGGVDAGVDLSLIALVEQGAAAKPLVPSLLAAHATAVDGDDVLGDAVEPGLRASPPRP